MDRRTLTAMDQAATLKETEARHLRWAGAAMLGAGVLLSRVPVGVGLPCPLRTVTGVPCPFCGMTTSVKETVSGDLVAAAAANPAGIGLVALVLYLLVARPTHVRTPPVALLGFVVSLLWLFELNRFGLI